MKKRNNILVASAVAIMLAPAALNALPQQTVDASAVGTVATTTPVYNASGKQTGQTLPSGSKWQLGQQETINGVAHYLIGTNEYIPASVVTNVTGATNSVDPEFGPAITYNTNPDAGKTVTANQALSVVDRYGNDTGTVLPVGSRWVIGEVMHANRMVYYQVGNNQYIQSLDVTIDGENNNTSSNTAADNYVETDGNFGKTGTITQVAAVVNDQGTNTGVVLPVNSSWKLGKAMHRDKQTFYQVATNEWVSFADMSVASSTTTNNNTDYSGNGSYITSGSTDAGKTGTVTVTTDIVNGHGDNTGKTVPVGSNWILGGDILHYDKQTYYQIATNEYISVAYVNVADNATTSTPAKNTNTTSSMPTPGNGLIATTKKNIQTYNTATNRYDQSLPANTSWKISKLVVNKYGSYWGQVGTNEWVWISDVNLNSGLNLPTYAYSEPEFATGISK